MNQTSSAVERVLLWTVPVLSAWLVVAMPVFAQESYYWLYAQHPDLSYFDHPPMVAWLIWLGTHLFGDSATGIRLGTCACGMGTVAAGRALLRAFGAGSTAQVAWLLLAACVPTSIATRFLANPDPPLVCAWLLTMLALWHARSGNLWWWTLAGLAAGSALLSKYTAIFLAAGGLAVLAADPVMRRQWRRPGPYLGVLVAAITFLPVVAWNVGNDFESFRFQSTGRLEHASFGLRWLGELIGGQLLVVNPFVALIVPAVVLWLWRLARSRSVPELWVLAFSVPLAAFLVGAACFVQVKINWLAPATTVGMLGCALWWERSGIQRRRPVLAWRLAVAAGVVGLLTLGSPLIRLLPQHRGTSWAGWAEIARAAERWESVIDDPDGIEGNVFFFAADYRDSAQLARELKRVVAELEPDEVVEPTLAQNVMGSPALQFDHWSPPRARLHQDAIFVVSRPKTRPGMVDMVRPHFGSMERVETVHVRRLWIEVLDAEVWICRDYRGPHVG
ncbi:MAG: glycosyltransferase family 39 protein [Planctomycetes bacterium]|nr:glycosyltransferase family 39 protein [Planctomycetota bacterium]